MAKKPTKKAVQARPVFDHYTVSAAAARAGWARLMRQEIREPLVWYRPGEMVLADESPGEGWQLAEESVERLGKKAGWMPPDRIVAAVMDIARRIPWLPPGHEYAV